MGSLSICTHRALVHWQMLLVAVSIFNFCCQPTTAQVSIGLHIKAGRRAVPVPLHNAPPNATAFIWYRGQSTERNHMIAFLITHLRDDIKGPAYSGRESINSNGSLQIDNATTKDTGMYTVVVYVTDVKKEIGLGRLIVYEPDLVVSVNVSNTTVTENKDTVVFTCKTNGFMYRWVFNDTLMPFNVTMLSSKDRYTLPSNERISISTVHHSLIIDPVKREDAGTYQCQVFNPISALKSSPIVLHVNFNDTHFLP